MIAKPLSIPLSALEVPTNQVYQEPSSLDVSLIHTQQQTQPKSYSNHFAVTSVSVTWIVLSFACVKRLIDRVNAERRLNKRLGRRNNCWWLLFRGLLV